MNLEITPFNDLYTEAHTIQQFLEVSMSDDANEAFQRGCDLMVYIARTGKMKADAGYHLNAKLNSEIVSTLRGLANDTPYATSTSINKLIGSLCKEEQFLYDMVERLNRTATHQYEWCRSLISAAKSEFILSKRAQMQRT